MPETIRESTIRNWVGGPSLSRGQTYVRQKALFNLQREGNILKGFCHGSSPVPYQLRLVVNGNQIDEGMCSCPVGAGGRCKHAAALLLTWLHEPQTFPEVAPLADILNQMDKPALVQLLHQIITLHPELEEMVRLNERVTMPESGGIPPELVQRQVAQVIAQEGFDSDDYYAAARVARKLETVLAQGQKLAQQEKWEAAAAFTLTFIETLKEQMDEVYDHDGELYGVLGAAAEQLGHYLDHLKDGPVRQQTWDSLLELCLEDIRHGGIGMGDDAMVFIKTKATPAEKQTMAIRVQALINQLGPKRPDEYTSWGRQAYGNLLLTLQGDTMSDEAFIELCRRTHRWDDLVNRLLNLNRIDDALAVLPEVNDYELLSLADIFVAHDQAALAGRFMAERASRSRDNRLKEWLKNWATQAGNWAEAVNWAEQAFLSSPDLESYLAIQKLAAHTGDWDKRRLQLLAFLGQNSRYHDLTEIHLEEGDIAAALQTLPQARAAYHFAGQYHANSLPIRVAEAATVNHPAAARDIYLQMAQTLIKARQSSDYGSAAALLKRTRPLYEKLGDLQGWHTLIKSYKEHKPRLPALLRAMQDAGF